jgi:predicted ATP-grasp superfamily ATP-dependent carboligase
VYRESIPLDMEVLDAGRRLLDDLDWRGVAMVEYKRDAVSGRPVFMEVNGRFWGSLQLAIDAGVDFPALLASWVADSPAPRQAGYRCGVRLRWWWGDVDHLYQRLRDGTTWRARLAAVRTFLDWKSGPRRDLEEVWRLRDPWPFLLETAQWLGRTLARRRPVRLAVRREPRRPVLEADRLAPAQPRRERVGRGHVLKVGLESQQHPAPRLQRVGEGPHRSGVQRGNE